MNISNPLCRLPIPAPQLLRRVLAAALFLLVYLQLSAQSQSSPNTVSINAGASLAGLFVKSMDLNDSISSTSYPAVQLNYDRCIKNWFSIGLATSYQHFGLKYTDYQMVDNSYGILSRTLSARVSRLNIAARALFHYGNSGNMDMYSGFRLGYTKTGIETDYSDVFNAEKFNWG